MDDRTSPSDCSVTARFTGTLRAMFGIPALMGAVLTAPFGCDATDAQGESRPIEDSETPDRHGHGPDDDHDDDEASFELVFDELADTDVYEFLSDLEFDKDGNLYLLFNAEGDDGPISAFVTRYTRNGTTWTKDWTWSIDGSVAYLHGIDTDRRGRLVAVGNEPFAVESPGAILFVVDTGAGTTVGEPVVFPCEGDEAFKDFFRVESLPGGDVVVAVTHQGKGDDGYFYLPAYLMRVDPETGEVVWKSNTQSVPASEYGDLVLKGDDILAVGRGPGFYQTWVVEVDDSGVLEHTYDLGEVQGLELVRSDDLFVVPGANDGVLAYDRDFAQKWVAAAPVVHPQSVAVSKSDRIFVVGTSDTDPFGQLLAAHDPDGTLLWTAPQPLVALGARLASWKQYVAAVADSRDPEMAGAVRIYRTQ